MSPLPEIPTRDELPFRRLERAHLSRVRCLAALAQADDELQEAITDLARVGYDVSAIGLDPPAFVPPIPIESRRA